MQTHNTYKVKITQPDIRSQDINAVTNSLKNGYLSYEKNCNAEPLNLSNGEYFSIGELALIINKLLNYSPKIIYDHIKLMGQRRRVKTNN